MKSKKNAFTLIELLAIIVILAIIAVITVPIILNIIENSRMGAVKDSAYGYKDAINKWYVSRLSENPNYNIASGTYSTEIFGDTTEGNKPDNNSYVEIENNNIINGCLQFDEYKVEITDGKINEAEKGTCEELETRMIINTDNKGRLYYNTEWINNNPVYLDPTNLENNCNENNSSSTTLTKSGCMKWYAYSENADGTVNMILDHNTTDFIPWTTYSPNNGNMSFGIKGPREALYQMYEDAKNWNGVNKLSTTDNYTPTSMPKNYDEPYTINYSKHLVSPNSYEYSTDSGEFRARFIEAEELSTIINKSELVSGNNWFDGSSVIQSNLGKGNSKYAWLFENIDNCEKYGCNNSTNNSVYGYWTSTVGNNYSPTDAFVVSNMGEFHDTTITNTSYICCGDPLSSHYGIRPVVKVSKSIIGM